MSNAFAIMKKRGKLEEFQYDPGPLRNTEVEIGVEYCGICHSDISMIENDWGRSLHPLVPGHGVIGRITLVGASVTTLVAGDLVGLGWHSDYCMTCSTCMSGDHNLCSSARPTIQIVQEYPVSQINNSIARLRSGAARYRVLINMNYAA